MLNQVKKVFYFTSTAIALTLICTATAQANVYATSQTNLQDSARPDTPALATSNEIPVPQWPAAVRGATTLRLTPVGLAPLNPTADLKAIRSEFLLPMTVTMPGRDQITTASVPSMATPASPSLSQTIRQDRALFGAHRIRFGKIGSGTRISDLIRKAAASGASSICINDCAALADRLNLGMADVLAQLRHVSSAVNKLVTYRTDEQNHDRLDQWSTPNETLGRASGDCEDYAILKMAVLAHLGVPVNAMEIVVVKDTRRRLFHAVLSVNLEDRTVILDNMTDAVESDTAKRSYAPLFSLSGTANYVFGYKGGKQNLTASLKNIAKIAPGAGF